MKALKQKFSCLLIVLSALLLCSCARSPLPVESYQSTESAGQDKSLNSPEALKVQAEFDAFTNEIFKTELSESALDLHFLLRSPENYGIEAAPGVLNEVSEAAFKNSTAEVKKTKERLESFDTALLTESQLFTYNMFLDYLETEVSADGLELYTRVISPVIGTQAQLPILLAEYSFLNKADVENYLSLLTYMDTYYKQLADYEAVRADAGLASSDATLDRIIQSCKDYMIRPESSFLTETFQSKLEDIPVLSEEEKNEYKARHLTILKEHFIPAYEQLSASLEALKGRGVNENGLYYFKDGKRYYEYLVASKTGTTSSVAELKKRIGMQMGEALAELTLLEQNHPDLFSKASSYSFSKSNPEEILNILKDESLEDFPKLEESFFTVKQVPKALESSLSPAFFLVPPIDAYNEATIYINGLAEQTDGNLYTTLAHEGYPGHLYQSLYFSQRQSCPLRHIIGCDGYSEGWGTYAEFYSYSFDNGISKELQQFLSCNAASALGLYALLDIHIHYDGWDLAKTGELLKDYYGIEDQAVVQEIYQSLIDNPANYLTYYTGYMEIMDMRERAETALGAQFSPKEFHKFILDMETAPFRVIEPYFEKWLSTYDINKQLK